MALHMKKVSIKDCHQTQNIDMKETSLHWFLEFTELI